MAENILKEIADYSRQRVEKLKDEMSLSVVKLECGRIIRVKIDETLGTEVEPFKGKFYEALAKPGLSVIAELKKASPSKGIISKDFSYLSRAVAYEVAGADCVSCVTEPKWFLGEEEMIVRVKKEIEIPILRKDFFVDEYQLYQSRIQGADAVLLIVAILDDETLKNFLHICDVIKLDAVVEAHDEEEVKRAVAAGAKIIGVNNRNLEDFSMDTANSAALRASVPDDILFVAESGFATAEDAKGAAQAGADAILVGEALMRTDDYMNLIRDMKNAGNI